MTTITKICTWNVNGIRSRRNVADVFKEVAADIYCIQETKISKDQISEELALVDKQYFSCFVIPSKQGFRGRSGCATYYRDSARPCHAEYGLFDAKACSDSWKDVLQGEKVVTLQDIKSLDSEGRVLITCHDIEVTLNEKKDLRKLYLLNIYFPRLDPEKEGRIEFKHKFNRLVEQKVNHYLNEPGSHVIIACDLNIKHKQLDGFEKEDNFDDCIYRQWLTRFLEPKESLTERHLVDSFRKFYPDKKYAYTCWPAQIVGARENNIGDRIDYLLVDSDLLEFAKDVKHLTRVPGSDHCPVVIEFERIAFIPSKSQPNECTQTWPKFAWGKRQTNLKSFFSVIPKSQTNIEENNQIDDKKTTNLDLKIYPHTQLTKKRLKNDQSNSSPISDFTTLTPYELVMFRGAVKPKARHCQKCGKICLPQQNKNKTSKQFMKHFFRCPDKSCKYFRWV